MRVISRRSSIACAASRTRSQRESRNRVDGNGDGNDGHQPLPQAHLRNRPRAGSVPGPGRLSHLKSGRSAGVTEADPSAALGSGTRSAAQSHAINPATSVVIRTIMAGVQEVEVVVAHNERATLRVGDVFLKIDADQTRTDVEVEAMAMAPIPTPEVLWRKPPVLALAALPGTALGRLGEPSTASPAAWAAAGASARMLHDAPLPPWPGWSPGEFASHLDSECEWLVANGVLPAGLVTRNRQVAEAAL